MRNRFVVSYDISDPKRLRLMHKKLSGFGEPVQYSVFLCPLSEKERILLLEMVTDVIHHQDDWVMIIDLGPAEGRGTECIEFVGRKYTLIEPRAVVV